MNLRGTGDNLRMGIISSNIEVDIKFKRRFKILGIFQLIVGLLCFIWGGVLLAPVYSDRDPFALVAPGMWCGAFFLIAGFLGTVSSFKPNHCPIVGGMVMAIFAALASLSLLLVEIFATYTVDIILSFSNPNEDPNLNTNVPVTFHSLLCVFAFIELILSIIHATYAGYVICGCCGSNPPYGRLTEPILNSTVEINYTNYGRTPQASENVSSPLRDEYLPTKQMPIITKIDPKSSLPSYQKS